MAVVRYNYFHIFLEETLVALPCGCLICDACAKNQRMLSQKICAFCKEEFDVAKIQILKTEEEKRKKLNEYIQFWNRQKEEEEKFVRQVRFIFHQYDMRIKALERTQENLQSEIQKYQKYEAKVEKIDKKFLELMKKMEDVKKQNRIVKKEHAKYLNMIKKLNSH